MKTATSVRALLAAFLLVALAYNTVRADSPKTDMEKNVDVRIEKLSNQATKVTINVDGSQKIFELPELSEGESKTLDVEGEPVEISKSGGVTAIVVAGETIRIPGRHAMHKKHDKKRKIILKQRGEGDDILVIARGLNEGQQRAIQEALSDINLDGRKIRILGDMGQGELHQTDSEEEIELEMEMDDQVDGKRVVRKKIIVKKEKN